jgi:hypothetical protein
MQAFGLLSLLIAVVLGVWWLMQTPAMTPVHSGDSMKQSYGEMIDSARAIPGAGQE